MAEIIQKTEAQKAHELERLKAWVKKLLGGDADRFDLVAESDLSLNYLENKNQLREKLRPFLKDLNEQSVQELKEKAEIAKAQQEQLDNERIKEAEKEVEDYNKALAFPENKDLDAYYSPIARGVNKLCQGYSNLLFIKGRGGIGKSYQIRKALAKNKAEYVEICGEVTEAYLYKLIFDNNGKVIWFKDVVKLLTSIGCLPFYTKVMTKDGIKEIQQINPEKDMVASWNFRLNKMEYKKFDKWKTGTKKVVKIKTKEGVLECSPEHKWIVKSNGKIIEKKAKDLNIKDVLLRL